MGIYVPLLVCCVLVAVGWALWESRIIFAAPIRRYVLYCTEFFFFFCCWAQLN